MPELARCAHLRGITPGRIGQLFVPLQCRDAGGDAFAIVRGEHALVEVVVQPDAAEQHRSAGQGEQGKQLFPGCCGGQDSASSVD